MKNLSLSACSSRSDHHPVNKDIAGPDVDGNGIRDDVDEWIATQKFDPKLEHAVKKAARADRVLAQTEPVETEAFYELIKQEFDAYKCVMDNTPRLPGSDSNQILAVYNQIRRLRVNTRERFLHDDRVSAAFSGQGYSIPFTPEEKAAACL